MVKRFKVSGFYITLIPKSIINLFSSSLLTVTILL